LPTCSAALMPASTTTSAGSTCGHAAGTVEQLAAVSRSCSRSA
jgi:hypothetical protein